MMRGVIALVAEFLVLFAIPGTAAASEQLWTLLKQGGQVILMRHAREAGEAFRARGIAVDRVLASPWCRCMETAPARVLARREAAPALGNLYGRSENSTAQVRENARATGRAARHRQCDFRFSWVDHRGADGASRSIQRRCWW
jgi:hypothetical protein